MEAQGPARPRRVDTVEHERVEVDVQVEGIPETLHERDRSALSTRDAPMFPRTAPERSEDRMHEDCEDGARELGVIGQAIAESEGEREHPLADGDHREDAIDQVRRRICHAAPTARWTESAALARERDHAVETAAVAVNAQKAMRQHATAKEGPELALDEARHGPLASVCPCEERFELRLHRLVQHALVGAALYISMSFGAAGRDMPMGKRRCLGGHPTERLPASYQSPGRSNARLRARSPRN